MAKTVYNKNVANPSDVTASIFSSDEQLKYGEIVLCNNINEPGIYIFTKSDDGETKIQKMNSVDNIILKQDVDPSASGAVANGDTLYEMVSKFQNQIDDLSGDGKSEAEKVNKIVAAVGINEDGSYKIISGNYVGNATSIADAISKLDAAINTVSGSSVKEAKEYTDAKITESIKALDAETSAGDGEEFVKITEADGLVSGEVKALSVEKDATGLKYDLKLGDYIFGSVDIPQDQFLKEAIFISAATVDDIAEALTYGQSIEHGKPYLKFVWKLEKELKPTYVDVSGLIDVYTAADVKLSDAYSGTSFDIKSGTSVEDAIGKVTNELTSIEENIESNKVNSSEKTINVTTSDTGTNIDINIDNDTIVKNETVAKQGQLSVALNVEKTYVDNGYVRTKYTLKSKDGSYGVINDTRDVFVGDETDGFIKVETQAVSDAEGNRTDKITITPVIQKTVNNATGPNVDDANGFATAWGVKEYVRSGIDGDGIMAGDDVLQPYENYRGHINFDSSSIDYDTVHKALYKTDNNMQLLDEALGFESSGQNVHQYPSATTQDCLLIKDDRTVMDALKTLDKAIADLDFEDNCGENQVFTAFTQENGHVRLEKQNVTGRKLAEYSVVDVTNPSGATFKVAEADTLGQALGKLQGQINAMDWTGTTASDQVFTGITEKDGLVSASTADVTTRTLKGYSVQNITDTSAAASKIATGDTLGVGLGKLQGQINAMDYTANTSSDKVFTYISNKDGQLTTSAENITNRVITGYVEGTDADVAATDTLGQALGKLQKQINSMDYTANTGNDKIFTYIAEADGKLTTSAESITSRVITGYAEGADADVAETDTLGVALGKLQGQINAMDKATQAEENSVIYDVTESDGKVSATSKHIVDIKLSGYTEGAIASGRVSSGDTLGQALGKLQGQVNDLDWTGATTANEVFTGITESDGKVSATTALTTSRTLSGYTVETISDNSATASKVAPTDTLGKALGKLQGQINAMDLSSGANDNKVMTDLTQKDGQLTPTYSNVTSRKLDGYGTTANTKVTATQTLGVALGNLQGQIDSLNYTANASTDKVITAITQTDGKVEVETQNITSRIITGYAEGTDADVAATDTLGQALGKLQKQINSMDKTASSETGKFVRTVAEADGKVSETRGYIVADDVKITAATVNEANVKEAWKLVNNEGTQLGSTIKIYKDSSLKSVALSGDTSTVGQWLVFTYALSDGSEDVVAVDVSKFLVQAEFQSGVTADNSGIVHGVVYGNSESVVTAYTATGGANGTAKVLGVNGDGFYVNNIQTAINAKVNSAISLLDSSSATTNAGYYMTGITITDGKVTAIGQAQLTAQETKLSTGNSTTAIGNVVTGLSVSDHAITLNKKDFPEVAWKRVSAGGANIDATTTADTISIVTGNTGITLDGDTTNKKITISHTDTSSQSSVDAGSGKFIKSVSVDTYGHVTGLTTGNTVDSATTAANSAKVAGKTVGNANGNVPLSNGTVNTNLNADMIDGKHVAVVSAIPSSPDANTIYILA